MWVGMMRKVSKINIQGVNEASTPISFALIIEPVAGENSRHWAVLTSKLIIFPTQVSMGTHFVNSPYGRINM